MPPSQCWAACDAIPNCVRARFEIGHPLFGNGCFLSDDAGTLVDTIPAATNRRNTCTGNCSALCYIVGGNSLLLS